MLSIGGFVLCATLVLIAGKRLSFYGDVIAEATGMGRVWFGLIMMATVTSLPELVVGISSAAWVRSADLAVGDVLGSCAFNLGILSLMDIFIKDKQPLLGQVARSHILAATLGIILLSMVGVGLFLPRDIIVLGWVGLLSVIFIVIYILSVRLIYFYEQKEKAATVGADVVDKYNLPLKKALTRYILFSLLVVGAALMLPHFAESIAAQSGLKMSFVGTLFLAASTSLPEIAVSLAAVRMGAVDLAVGNLFGSNIFNILILAVDDIFYTGGNLLKDASDHHLLSVFASLMMTAVAIIGITYRGKTKRYLMAWDTLLILLIYLTNLYILYRL